MNELQWVDELYRAFCQTLPGMLHAEAQGLPRTLGLAPRRDVPWSAVFSHSITLAAPAMLAEAMPSVRGTTVQDALLAHMLAVIDAFGTDRLADGQVRATWQLETLLAHVRRARDAAMERLRAAAPGPGPEPSFAAADEVVARAIDAEHHLLRSGEPVDVVRYRALSRDKQRLGVPASLGLAAAAGWDERRRRALDRMLESIWLGLQFHDDVMDWEDDWARGAAWAVALARGLRRGGDLPPGEAAPGGAADLAAARRLVMASGVLARMLELARREFAVARRLAAVLGARRLEGWASAREAQMAELARAESASPGYAHRARVLSAWARTVLA